MKLTQRLKNLLPTPHRGKRHTPYARQWAAAKMTRLTEEWALSTLDINAELRKGLDAVRSRARESEQNNDFARRYLAMGENNIVGRGVKLQSRVMDGPGKPDKGADAKIETGWKAWGRAATVDGMPLEQASRLALRTVMRDGEVIVMLQRGWDNPHNFAIRLLESDYLDTKHQAELDDGRSIYMGVEMDQFGAATGLWLSRYHPGDERAKKGKTDPIRHDAKDTKLVFLPERPGQIRGISWMASSLARMHHLEGYAEAEVIAARIAACKMGFYKVIPGEDYHYDTEKDAEMPLTNASPGTFEKLPTGWSVDQYDPQHPNQQYGEFVKSSLRSIASGLRGASYNTLANDLEGVNYTSLREGKLTERDEWMVLQDWWISVFYRPIFAAWLQMWLMSDASTLPYAKYDKFLADTWQPRRWQWVDPVKDMMAQVVARENGWKPDSQIISEIGGDIDDVYAQMISDAELAANVPPSPIALASAEKERPITKALARVLAKYAVDEAGEIQDVEDKPTA